MPHLFIEHSANLETRVDLPALQRRLHAVALETGVFEEKALRARIVRREHYRIADGHPDNAFLHLTLRVRHGRSLETRRQAGDKIFAALVEALADDIEKNPLAISFEIQEIDAQLSWKNNNLPEWLKKRARS